MTISSIENINTLVLYINGKLYTQEIPDVKESLVSFLRRQGLTGTKTGCSEGGCGSCTVAVSRYNFSTRKLQHYSINACLAPVVSMHMKHVITIEGLGTCSSPHPTQTILAESHSSQCGYCTPGIVMSLYSHLKISPNSDDHEIEDAFDGNLCRCTGYRPILEGAKKFSCSRKCSDNTDVEDLYKQFKSKEIQFPKQLLTYYESLENPRSFVFSNLNSNERWFHPSSINDLLEIMNRYPNAKIVNGNSEVGIEMRFKNQKYKTFVNPSEISELSSIVESNDGITFGASVTLSEAQIFLSDLLLRVQVYQKCGIKAILDNIKYFAGRQIRNTASLSGNICTASPISDLNPVWISLGASVKLLTLNSSRNVALSDFFIGYRKTGLNQSEILSSLFVPFTKKNEYVMSFKQAKRRDDDIAIVNACFRVLLDINNVVQDSCLAYGGMGAVSAVAKNASRYLLGKSWNLNLSLEISPIILQDFPLSASSPGGQIEFRKTLSTSFFHKFVIFVQNQISSVDPALTSAIHEIHRPISCGQQVFTETEGQGAVGKSHKHVSAMKQVTGEAIYVDDMPPFHNELYGAIVGSAHAYATILSIDSSVALGMPGVVDFVSAADFPASESERNIIGPVFKDEELFATNKVYHIGQMIGMIIATNEHIAREAAKYVKITYEKHKPIVTIEDAIEAKSFFPHERIIKTGKFLTTNDSNAVNISEATHFVEGTARISGQEHFYLETQASIVVPGNEDDEIEVYASTQNPTETQHLVAHVLGIDTNKVVCRVKRMGGGFGGKETRSVFISCALAVAAKKLKRPIRCMLTREEDMAISGTRHPFLGKYKVGFTDVGKLVSLELEMFSNGGYSMDLSLAVLERSLTHSDNSYNIPNVNLKGVVCKTNLATNTAFRGFGGPQGLMVAEIWIEHVADFLKIPAHEIREINLYQNGDVTHFSMPLEEVYLPRVWQELLESSDFKKREIACIEYNKRNKYRKRGLAIMPTKFGLAFTARFLNQAGALVHVYSDGSIRISHGGTEMGQGLHTKMIQIVSQAFNVPMSLIHLSETRTDIVANTSATAASVSSDLNGMAIQDACNQIIARLDPLRKENPNIEWKDIVRKAYFERINLSANGFYKTPDLTYDWSTNTGRMFSYFTYGAACTEVEIDTLSGDHVVLRSDIIMDIGRSLNPAIDIGQIEGAFVQGQGWCTIEEPLFSPETGFLLTRGPGLYKIPGFKDIPIDFRVNFLNGVRNSRAIHSSKAVGEPPLFLGASVFFAIKNAINAARQENGINDILHLSCPATSERIRLACKDEFSMLGSTPLKPGEFCWGVPS